MILSVPGLSGLWLVRCVILSCFCVIKIMERPDDGNGYKALQIGNKWYCGEHRKLEEVTGFLPATVGDREQLTRTEQ